MRLITYEFDEQIRLGALWQELVVDLGRAAARAAPAFDWPDNMIALLAHGEAGLAAARAALELAQRRPEGLTRPLSQVRLLPPVTRPAKVLALGRNYAAHAREGGAEPPAYPMLFHKGPTCLLGAGGTIRLPAVAEQVDFEGELAVIIGRHCKGVAVDSALDYVAGYSAANDVTARDWQRRTSQFSIGKMADTFGPLGPALVTPDELPGPGNLRLQTRLNGAVMQDSSTRHMIFDVPTIISYISLMSTLEVGDVILTGTPEGVGFARTPPIWLRPGDEIVVEIEHVGTLTNYVEQGT